MMDTFFLPHATMGKTDSNPIMEFLRSWKDVVGVPKPKSILIVSAHWDTCDPTVSVFPYIHETTYESEDSTKSHLAKFKYPAPGAPQLGMRVKELLMESGFETVHEDSSRGLDHGAWFPLMLMYPEADIPVCEISIQSSKDGIHHYNMGKALAPLRAEGVLIIGSGGTISYVPPCIPPVHAPMLSWALEFNTWLKDAILTGR
ncbi:hypothetical protein RHSIM_Rhsim06G0044300 [Rhododendron simsii]|uniref:Extradiol ring-cleavage dioxygenase class III enzyme subunit B domain-containing protein n=1 Tax=Rhododendron simsii TaxID=118357 RepID=A0A834LLZ0_RHOSS|nr:hypothetical protein RHSIM_Rhsim06G0044300 [Rhododendron simsii]